MRGDFLQDFGTLAERHNPIVPTPSEMDEMSADILLKGLKELLGEEQRGQLTLRSAFSRSIMRTPSPRASAGRLGALGAAVVPPGHGVPAPRTAGKRRALMGQGTLVPATNGAALGPNLGAGACISNSTACEISGLRCVWHGFDYSTPGKFRAGKSAAISACVSAMKAASARARSATLGTALPSGSVGAIFMGLSMP
jgi:hypothetical protein